LIDHNASLITSIARLAATHSLRVATAESCTGGMIATVLTGVAGASQWFVGGVVSYDNAVKKSLLRVPQSVLDVHGAVSEETTARMCDGVMALLSATAVIAVSGVAGPGGGTAAKPVGTVCFALKINDSTAQTWTSHFSGERDKVRTAATTQALQRLAAALANQARRT